MIKKGILLANGTPPAKEVFRFLSDNGYKTLFCADGGANSAYELSLTPDYVIGDLDSIRDDVKDHFSSRCEIIHYERQDDTDLEKSLKFAIEKGFEEVVLLGGTGDRLDHTICNLGIVLKFFGKITIKLVHDNSILVPYADGEYVIKTIPNETVSLYGFNNETLITSEGLQYPLERIPLPFGVRESTSNVAEGYSVRLKIENGIVFVIRDFNLLRKYGIVL